MKLYPGHQHIWADPGPVETTAGTVQSTLVRCTVCGFEAPRNAAGLDGRMAESVRTNSIPANRTNPDQESKPA